MIIRIEDRTRMVTVMILKMVKKVVERRVRVFNFFDLFEFWKVGELAITVT
jgi:hypothetical protein